MKINVRDYVMVKRDARDYLGGRVRGGSVVRVEGFEGTRQAWVSSGATNHLVLIKDLKPYPIRSNPRRRHRGALRRAPLTRRKRLSNPTPRDLTYKTSGMFTMFFPDTPAGETAWREIARQTEGTGKILTAHLAGTLRQLRKAGYKVGG